VGRGDASFEERGAAAWLRLLLPVLVWVVAVAAVCGLVLGGVVAGGKTYAVPSGEPTTQPTVLIEPRAAKKRPWPEGTGRPA
jgi:hypothetical protein